MKKLTLILLLAGLFAKLSFAQDKTITRVVYFDLNSYEVKDKYYNLFNEIVRLSKTATLIEITGNTCTLADLSLNQPLSDNRAHAVATNLTNMGVPAEKIEVIGLNYSDSVRSNKTEEGRELNRRAEIVVHLHDSNISDGPVPEEKVVEEKVEEENIVADKPADITPKPADIAPKPAEIKKEPSKSLSSGDSIMDRLWGNNNVRVAEKKPVAPIVNKPQIIIVKCDTVWVKEKNPTNYNQGYRLVNVYPLANENRYYYSNYGGNHCNGGGYGNVYPLVNNNRYYYSNYGGNHCNGGGYVNGGGYGNGGGHPGGGCGGGGHGQSGGHHR